MKDEEIDKMADDFVNAQEFTKVYGVARKAECGAFWKYGFLAGLKAGRPQWHDLRKDPNDYPKQVGKCIRVVEWNGDEHIGYTEWYEPSEDEIGFGSLVVDLVVNGFSFEFDNIMAWCEIPTFDKE